MKSTVRVWLGLFLYTYWMRHGYLIISNYVTLLFCVSVWTDLRKEYEKREEKELNKVKVNY